MTTGWHLSEDHLRGRPTLFLLGRKLLVYGGETDTQRHFPGGLVGGHAGPIENGASEALPLVNLIQGVGNDE